jgi:hypothetical protein
MEREGAIYSNNKAAVCIVVRRSLYYIEEEWNRGPTKVLG